MPSLINEEERIEKAIQGLMKLQDNRICINCNSLEPQYVCTTFWTFVCTACSGVHREFTHQVKSVSLAKFSAEDVSSLQAGGNERAREIYFKTWNSRVNSLPDSRNLMKLRNFIKYVYVERRFTGERSLDKLAMLKLELKDGDFFEKPSHDKSSFSGSYPKGGHNSRSLRNFIEERNPRYQESENPRAHRTRSCDVIEIVDDRFCDDNYGNIRHYDSHQFSGSLQKGLSLSGDLRKSSEIAPWDIQSFNEIRGDINRDEEKLPDYTRVKKTAESSNRASSHRKREEQKPERSSSMIDIKVKDAAVAEPESPVASVSSNTHHIVPSSNGENSRALSQTQIKPPPTDSRPRSVNSVEALLLELVAPVGVSDSSNTSETALNGGNVLALPSSGQDSLVEFSDKNQLQETQQCYQPSESLTVDGNSTEEQSSLPTEASSSQLSWPSPTSTSQAQTRSDQHSWPSPEPNSQTISSSQSAPSSEKPVSSNSSAEQLSQVDRHLPLVNSPANGLVSVARKPLPVEMFTSPYSFYPAPLPYRMFRPAQPMGMGLGMQYNSSALPLPGPVASKSKNPFDIDDDGPQAQNPVLLYAVPSQGSLSNQMGIQSQPSPHAFSLALHPQHLPSYGMAIPPGVDMRQQPPNVMQVSSRQEDNRKIDDHDDALASLNPLQLSISRSEAPAKGRNPFG